MPSLNNFIMSPLSGLGKIDVQHDVIVIGQYRIRANIQREHTRKAEHYIFQPLPSMIEVFTGILVLSAEKTSSNGSADDMDVGCFPGTDLSRAYRGFGMGYSWLRLYGFTALRLYGFTALRLYGLY